MLKAIIICGVLLCGSAFAVAAQEDQTTNCAIDIRAAVAALSDAQAFADDGDTSGAQDALDEVVAAVADLQRACEDAEPIILEADYQSDDGTISLSIPEGWTVEERIKDAVSSRQETYTVFTLSPDAETVELFADDAANLNDLAYPIGLVMVASPFSIVRELGLLDPNAPLEQIATTSEIAAYLNAQFQDIVGVNNVTPVETVTNTDVFSFEGSGDIPVNGTIYLRDRSNAGVFVGIFTPEAGENGAALAHAIGDSVAD